MDKRSILNRFNSWEEVPAAVRAWITIRAKEQGKNPVMVHAGYKAAFARRGNVSRKETKSITYTRTRCNKKRQSSKAKIRTSKKRNKNSRKR